MTLSRAHLRWPELFQILERRPGGCIADGTFIVSVIYYFRILLK